jgi:hypothetical protein
MVIPFFGEMYIPGDATHQSIPYDKLNNYISGLNKLADMIEKSLDMNYLKCILEVA